METDEFREPLHSIELISPCAVAIELDGKLEIVADDKVVGDVFAHGEVPVIPDTVEKAKSTLDKVLVDFKFVSTGDKSRAYASLITPALVMGGLLKGRATIDLTEANESQAGKGYRHKLITAIYKQKTAVVNFGQSGLGSAERSVDSALVSGCRSILLDNVRGKIASQKIESLITEDGYSATVPHSPDVTIDPTRIVVSMTTNEASLNRDLANRAAAVRIKKQKKDYEYATYPEGDILEHVRANQPEFHGAVLCIVQEWFNTGCQVDTKAMHEHDFSRWAGVMNHVVTKILGEPDMFKGYADVRKMLHNPRQSWMREVARVLLMEKTSTDPMQTSELLKELEEAGREDLIPSLKDYETLEMGNCARKSSTLAGRRLSVLFRDTDEISIEGVSIKRTIETKPRIGIDAEGKQFNKGDRETPCYSFELVKD